jgi:hypothetical protein
MKIDIYMTDGRTMFHFRDLRPNQDYKVSVHSELEMSLSVACKTDDRGEIMALKQLPPTPLHLVKP